MKDALYTLQEMAFPEAHHALLFAADQVHLIDNQDDIPQERLAMQVWLDREAFIEWEKAKNKFLKLASFRYFHPAFQPDHPIQLPSAEAIQRLAGNLEEYFKKTHRGGQGASVEAEALCPSQFRFTVRHGDVRRWVYSIEKQRMRLISFRPEDQDTVLYLTNCGEIWINAHHEEDIEIYRREFGLALTGRSDYFSQRGTLTLEPLRAGWVDASGIKDIEEITLRKIKAVEGGAFQESDTKTSHNIFAHSENLESMAWLPELGELVQALFVFKFAGSTALRRVKICLPDTIKLQRIEDAPVVAAWLSNSGIRIPSEDTTITQKAQAA